MYYAIAVLDRASRDTLLVIQDELCNVQENNDDTITQILSEKNMYKQQRMEFVFKSEKAKERLLSYCTKLCSPLLIMKVDSGLNLDSITRI